MAFNVFPFDKQWTTLHSNSIQNSNIPKLLKLKIAKRPSTFFKSRFRLVTSRSTPHKTIQKHGTGGTPVPSRKLQVQNTRSNGEIEMPKLTGKIDESTLSPQLNLKEPRERFELVSYMNVNLPTCTQKGLGELRNDGSIPSLHKQQKNKITLILLCGDRPVEGHSSSVLPCCWLFSVSCVTHHQLGIIVDL